MPRERRSAAISPNFAEGRFSPRRNSERWQHRQNVPVATAELAVNRSECPAFGTRLSCRTSPPKHTLRHLHVINLRYIVPVIRSLTGCCRAVDGLHNSGDDIAMRSHNVSRIEHGGLFLETRRHGFCRNLLSTRPHRTFPPSSSFCEPAGTRGGNVSTTLIIYIGFGI
jgi:hypothetical protein